MKQVVLITGAAGFIGSFLSEALIARGYAVIGVDNFFRGMRENIQQLMGVDDFSLRELDLSDSATIPMVREILMTHQIKTIFHLAAINGTQYFYDKPLFVLDKNIRITQNLLSAIQGTAVNYVIYTSSSEVYGDALTIPTNEQQPIM